MSDGGFFRQKGTGIARGVDQQAVDANPSEQSGFAAPVEVPIWKSFVDNKAFQESNREAINTEQQLMRESARQERQPRPSPWQGSNGFLSTTVDGIKQDYDAEQFVDHPELAPLARKSLFDRELKSARRDAIGMGVELSNPLLKARELTPKQREEIMMTGAGLAETDPKHFELKARLVADEEARAQRQELERKRYDAKVRAQELAGMDADTWWQTRSIQSQKPDPVAGAVAEKSQADQAHAAAQEERKALFMEAAGGANAERMAQIQARVREIDGASEVIADARVGAEKVIQGEQAKAQQQVDDGFWNGDMMRGARVSIGQALPVLKGAVGLVGETLGIESVKDWGLRGYKEGMAGVEPLQREHDDVTKAWEKAKSGDVGALADWAQYGIGYLVGQVGEAAAMGLIGSAIGGAATGPAAPAGAAGGAVTGVVAKGAVKAAAKGLIEQAIERQAVRMLGKQAAKMSTEEIAKHVAKTEVRKAAGARLGQLIASYGSSAAQELGSIYPEAAAEGRAATGTDLARIWATGLGAGALEAASDVLGFDAITGKLGKLVPGSRALSSVAGAGVGMAAEGGTEVAQTALERVGSGKEVFSKEGVNEMINAGALGALGGGVAGAASGFVDPAKNPEQKLHEDVNTSIRAIDPEHAPATPDEISLATTLSTDNTPESVARGVLIEREIAGVDDAQKNFVRAVVKLAGGANPIGGLTEDELGSLGWRYDRENDTMMKLVDDPPIRNNTLTGEFVIKDSTLQAVESISPTAKKLAGLTETQQLKRINDRLNQPEWDVETHDGGIERVKAASADEAMRAVAGSGVRISGVLPTRVEQTNATNQENQNVNPTPNGDTENAQGTQIEDPQVMEGDNSVRGESGGLPGSDAQLAQGEGAVTPIHVSAEDIMNVRMPETPSTTPRTERIENLNDPDTFYRVIVGDEAFNDIVESGTVRTNAGSKVSEGASLAERMKARTTAFPSFSKGKVSLQYAQENPNHYVVVSQDQSIKPSERGRHGKGKTMFPTSPEGQPLPSLPGEAVKVYRHTGDGNYELVYDGGKVVSTIPTGTATPTSPLAPEGGAVTPQAPQGPVPKWTGEAPPVPQGPVPKWTGEAPPVPQGPVPKWTGEAPPVPQGPVPKWTGEAPPLPQQTSTAPSVSDTTRNNTHSAIFHLNSTEQNSLADLLETNELPDAESARRLLISSELGRGMDSASLKFLAEEIADNKADVVSVIRESAKRNEIEEAEEAANPNKSKAREISYRIRANEALIAKFESPVKRTKLEENFITGEMEEVPLSEEQIRNSEEKRRAMVQELKNENEELRKSLSEIMPSTAPSVQPQQQTGQTDGQNETEGQGQGQQNQVLTEPVVGEQSPAAPAVDVNQTPASPAYQDVSTEGVELYPQTTPPPQQPEVRDYIKKRITEIGAKEIGDEAIINKEGDIEVNFEELSQSVERMLLPINKAIEYINRVIDHEIYHTAQIKAMDSIYEKSGGFEANGDFNAWREAYSRKIWENDFSGENKAKGDTVKAGYIASMKKEDGEALWNGMSYWAKFAEATRMMKEGKKTTEGAFLWSNISDTLYEVLRNVLKNLMTARKGLSKELKETLIEFRKALNESRKTTTKEKSTQAPAGKGTKQTPSGQGARKFKVGQTIRYTIDGKDAIGKVLVVSGDKLFVRGTKDAHDRTEYMIDAANVVQVEGEKAETPKPTAKEPTTTQPITSETSYDDLVLATYAGQEARRKFGDLTPIQQRYANDFHASGLPRSKENVIQRLKSVGVVGNVGGDVDSILKSLPIIDAIEAEEMAIRELNRRESAKKSAPKPTPAAEQEAPKKPKTLTELTEAVKGMTDDERSAYVVERVKQMEASDPNIGREWNSKYGRQRIVGLISNGGLTNISNPTYEVETVGSGSIRNYSASSIEKVIKDNEYELTPEYADEVREREERFARQKQREKDEAAKKQALVDEISEFTKGKPPLYAGKVREALMKSFLFDGKAMSKKAKIEELVADGKLPRTEEEPKIKPMTRSQFNRADNQQQAAHEKRMKQAGNKTVYYVGGYDMGKIGYDYAKFLIERKSNTKKPDTQAEEQVQGGIESTLTPAEKLARKVIEGLFAAKTPVANAPRTSDKERWAKFNRHEELEAKYNAGTITDEEQAEAEKIVDDYFDAEGYTEVGYRTGIYDDGKLLPPSTTGGLGSAYYAALGGSLDEVKQFEAPYIDRGAENPTHKSRTDKVRVNLGHSPMFFAHPQQFYDWFNTKPELRKAFESWLEYQYYVNTLYDKLKNTSYRRRDWNSPTLRIDVNPNDITARRAGRLYVIPAEEKADQRKAYLAQGVTEKQLSEWGYDRDTIETHDMGKIMSFMYDRGFATAIVIDWAKAAQIGMKAGDGRMFKEVAVADASQIKSAQPFTGVPLWRRADTLANSILRAATPPTAQSYNTKIPRDRFKLLMEAADSLVQEGVNTPEKLTETMKRIAPDNKAVQFTQSFWSMIRAIEGVEGDAEPDWGMIYNPKVEKPKPRKFAVNPASDFIKEERDQRTNEQRREAWIGSQPDKISARDIAFSDWEKLMIDVDNGRRGMTLEKAADMVESAVSADIITREAGDRIIAKIQPETAKSEQDTPPPIEPVKAPAAETKAAKSTAKRPATDVKKLKAQKEYLLAALDKAIEEVPETNERGSWSDETARSDYETAGAGFTEDTIKAIYEKYGVELAFPDKPMSYFDNRQALRQAIFDKHYVPSEHTRIIEISVPGDGTFRIVNDKKTLQGFRKKANTRFPTSSASDGLPRLTTPRETAITKTGSPKTNKDFIEIASIFVSNDPQREILHNVHSDGTNIVATNGSILIAIDKNAGGTEEKPIHFNGNTIKPVKDATYPGWKQVVSTIETKSSDEVNTAELQKIAIQAKSVAAKRDLGSPEGQRLIVWRDDTGNLGYSLENTSEKTESGAFAGGDADPETAKIVAAMNVHLVLDALKGMRLLGHEKIKMNFGNSPQSPVMLSADGVKIVISPTKTADVKAHPMSDAWGQDVSDAIESEKTAVEQEGKKSEESKSTEKSSIDVSAEQYRDRLSRIKLFGGASYGSLTDSVRQAVYLGYDPDQAYQDLIDAGVTPVRAGNAVEDVVKDWKMPTAKEQPKPTHKPKPPTELELLENYFLPGKVVEGYGGKDRVISFNPQPDGRWSVTVQAVEDPNKVGPRSHSTTPSKKLLVDAWENRGEKQSAQQSVVDKISSVIRGMFRPGETAVNDAIDEFIGETGKKGTIVDDYGFSFERVISEWPFTTEEISKARNDVDRIISQHYDQEAQDQEDDSSADDSKKIQPTSELDQSNQPKMTQSKPGEVEYRGFKIAKSEGIQLGYRTNKGSFGKGRKVSGYAIFDDEGNEIKFVDTFKEAKAYVDSYVGDEPTPPDGGGKQSNVGKATNPSEGLRAAPTPTAAPNYARHAELEAKHNAGTITDAEVEEARRIVEVAKGNAVSAWHGSGTDERFDVFKIGKDGADLGIHFGTKRQAEDRVHAKGIDTYRVDPSPYMRKVFLYGNFIKSNGDAGGWQFASDVAKVLPKRFSEGIEIPKKYDSEANKEAISEIRRRLVSSGYTGVEYRNTAESPGISYIVFSPNQIKSADPFTGVPLKDRFNPESPSILRAATTPTAAPPRATADFEKTKEFYKKLKEQEAVFPGSSGVDPRYANPGATPGARQMGDIARVIEETRKTIRKDTDTFQAARDLLKRDEAGIENMLFSFYTDAPIMMNDAEMVAADLLINKRVEEANGNSAKLENAMKLYNARILSRRENARALRIGYDKFMKPAERRAAKIVDSIFTLPKSVEKRGAMLSPTERKAFMERESKQRLAKVTKVIAELGIKIRDISAKNRTLTSENAKVMRDMLAQRDLFEQRVIRMVQRGASIAEIREYLGDKMADKAQGIVNKFREDLKAKIVKLLRAGKTRDEIRELLARDGLKAATTPGGTGLTDEQVMSIADEILESDFSIPKVVHEKPLPRVKKPSAKAAKTEAEIAKAAEEMATKWVNKLATEQSDTLSWSEKAIRNKNALADLIERHIRTGLYDFNKKAEMLGVSREQAELLDSLANEERKRRESIKDANERAKRSPMTEAQRIINAYAKTQSDTPSSVKKNSSAIRELIKKHLKSPVDGFRDQILALGVTDRQAEILSKQVETERKAIDAVRMAAGVESPDPRNSNWARPIFDDGLRSFTFDTKDRVNIMSQVEYLRSLVGAVGKISELSPDKRKIAEGLLGKIDAILGKYGKDTQDVLAKGLQMETFKFDINDVAQVAALARTISALDADFVDKASEYAYGSMLSGLQTMIKNETAIIPAVLEATVGRGFEMAINSFVNDPMSASLGEVKYIIRGLGPALTRAASNFVAAWKSQHPVSDRDLTATDADWEKMVGTGGHRMVGAIPGIFGDIVRIPLRLLAATDDFNRTLLASAEVGAFAYRLARAQGMKDGSAAMERFIMEEVNMPGSMSWHLASQKAGKMIFANPLPGQKDPHKPKYTEGGVRFGDKVEVRDIGDSIGYLAGRLTDAVAADHDNMVAKTLSAMLRISFFPFQRTPFNIIRKGVQYTPNLISLMDIGIRFVQEARTPDGKWQWSKGFRNAEIIERVGRQLQGAIVFTALMGMAEGDDDDEDKLILATGTNPYGVESEPERNARIRAGLGPYRLSIKVGDSRYGFSYGGIEPIATSVSATIDTIKSFKKKFHAGENVTTAAMAIGGSLLSQAKDKSFMRGFSEFDDLVTAIITEPDVEKNRRLKQFMASKAAMIMPNFIKQPIRESDPYFRDKAQTFAENLLYEVIPYGIKPEKIDPYGKAAEKMSSAPVRIVDVFDIGGQDVNKYDEMLVRWADSGKGKPWYPSPIKTVTLKNPRTGKEVDITPDQIQEFKKEAGKLVTARLKTRNFNFKNPTQADIDFMRDTHEKARALTKRALEFRLAK